MSRSGYTEDCEDWWQHIRWRGAVTSAFRGRRGQAFLREMLAALDALPSGRLIDREIITADGEVCALGAVARSRGLEGLCNLDPCDIDAPVVADAFGMPRAFVAEVMYENDDYDRETPEQRFARMRAWIAKQIR